MLRECEVVNNIDRSATPRDRSLTPLSSIQMYPSDPELQLLCPRLPPSDTKSLDTTNQSLFVSHSTPKKDLDPASPSHPLMASNHVPHVLQVLCSASHNLNQVGALHVANRLDVGRGAECVRPSGSALGEELINSVVD